MDMKSKRIYLLYSCDEWKGVSSMRLLVATTAEEVLNEQIRECFIEESAELDDKTGKEAADVWDEGERSYGDLKYLYVDIVNDGERQ